MGYGNDGIFLIIGEAGFISSTVLAAGPQTPERLGYSTLSSLLRTTDTQTTKAPKSRIKSATPQRPHTGTAPANLSPPLEHKAGVKEPPTQEVYNPIYIQKVWGMMRYDIVGFDV